MQTENPATAALTLTDRDPGVLGDLIRVEIDYDTANPEQTFNLTTDRSVTANRKPRVAQIFLRIIFSVFVNAVLTSRQISPVDLFI